MAMDPEIVRLMTNWAAWVSGASIGVAVSGAYALEARGRRADTAMPLLNGQAMDVDRAVEKLGDVHQRVVREYWLRGGRIEQKARACGCSVKALYDRLEAAHAQIMSNLAENVRVAKLRHEAYERMAAISRPSLIATTRSVDTRFGRDSTMASTWPVRNDPLLCR